MKSVRSIRKFCYSIRAVQPLLLSSKPDISELTEKEIMELKPNPSDSSPPQIQLAMPLRSQLRTLFLPSRQAEALLHLVDVAEIKTGRRRVGYKDKLKQIITDVLVDRSVIDGIKVQEKIGFLLHASCGFSDPQFLESILVMINRTDVPLVESHYNAILVAMDRCNWTTAVKRNFREMLSKGIKCRLETIFALVTSAVQRKDFEFAAELMFALTQGMYDRRRACPQPFPMEVVVDGCVGTRERGVKLIEQVLEWHRMSEATLSNKTVQSLIKWIKRCSFGEKKGYSRISDRAF